MSTHKSVYFRTYTLSVKSKIQTYNASYDLTLLKQTNKKKMVGGQTKVLPTQVTIIIQTRIITISKDTQFKWHLYYQIQPKHQTL